MALSSLSTNVIIDALTSPNAGNEFIAALSSGAMLSNATLIRLQDAMGDKMVGNDIQAAILGLQPLSLRDLQYMFSGFPDQATAGYVASNVAGGIAPSALSVLKNLFTISPNPIAAFNTAPPRNVSLPSASRISLSNPGLPATSAINLSAGSTFASTGPGAAFTIANANNTNQYMVWYNVSGGSNTNPTPAGLTGIEVTILSSDSAATVASKTNTAIQSVLVGMTTSVVSNVVSIVILATISQAATPSFSPAAGTYSSAQIVTISSLTAGASFYYTTNGSTPTTSSSLYAGPITVGVSETVKVLGVANGFQNSAVASSAYTISASPGVATQVVFTQEPIGAAQGANFATMPIVTIKDVSNATVTTGPDSTALITLALTTGTGVLSGTISMNAVAGVANFASAALQISLYGNKILSASKSATSATGVLLGYSTSFNVSNGLAAVNLNTAANYVILSESGISTTAGSAITGNIAVSPIAHTAITGFGLILDGSGQFSTSSLVTGEVFAADYSAPTPATLTTAVGDMGTAYTNAAGRTSPNFTNLGSGEIGGLTLVPGLYKWTSGVTISTNVTLSGGPNDVWIFQIAGTLSQAASISVLLTGGAVATNVFWQVAGGTTIGANAVFQGIILDQTSIALQTGATFTGRLLAQTAVTLQSNTITA